MLNSTITQTEVEVFRAQTGGAYRIKGAYGVIVRGSSFPAKGSIPVASGLSGTILSTGTHVRGTNTSFKSQITPGDFLYQKDVVRRVVEVYSDTLLEVEDAFPTDIAAPVIPMICRGGAYKVIYAKNVHASGAGILQEAPFASGNTFLGGGSPISFDASGGTIEFTLHQ